MGLTLKSVAQLMTDLQQGIIAALSGNPPAQQVTDFSDASLSGAYTESTATQLGFVQSQVPLVLAVTRLATCGLADAITFVADYNLSPPWLGPTYASSTATFTRRQAATSPVALLVGTIMQNPTPSPAAAVQYAVGSDPTNPKYSANAGGTGIPGYLDEQTVTVPIQAVNSGSASNVIANTLTVIASPNVPFDTVTNPSDIENGNDGETLAQLQQRFADWINTRSGTRFRIAAIVAGVQAGLSFTLNEYTNTDGTPRDGFTTVVVDDGSGAPPGSLLTAITTAVTDPVQGKSLGSQIVPIAATPVVIAVAVTGTGIKPGFSPSDVRAAIAAALLVYVNANGVGGAPAGTGSNTGTGKLSYLGVANVVASFIGTGSAQGLASYGAITVNGGSVDIPLTTFQTAHATSSSISVT